MNLVQLGPAYFPKVATNSAVGVGSIYIGNIDTDPTIVDNQKTVYGLQEDGTFISLAQPITLSIGGIPTYDGSPVSLYTNGPYSLTVLDINGSQIFYIPSIITSLTPGNFYYPDYNELDHGVVGFGSTIKAIVDEIGTTNKATIYFCHNSGNEFTDYILGTAETIPSNIKLEFEQGAKIKPAIGVSLTVYSPENVIAPPNQQTYDLSASGSIAYTVGGTEFPERYGVDGTADQTEINAAITAIPEGIVRLADNTTYNTTATITGKSNVTLKGGGRGSTIIDATGNINTITLTGSVTGGQTVSVQAAAGQMDVQVADGSGFSADDDVVIGKSTHNSFENYTDYVEINRVDSVAVNTLTMEAPLYDTYVITDYLVYIATLVKNFVVDGIGFTQQSTASPKYFINATYAQDCIIKNCSFSNGYRVEINVCDNVRIEDNVFDTMNLLSVKRSQYTKILNNTLTNFAQGIVANYNSDETHIIGNTIKYTSVGVGITAGNLSRHAVISKNTILYPKTYGISLDWNSWYAKITKNEIGYSVGNYGIIYVGNWATIANNVIHNAAMSGLRIEDGQYNTISGNKLSNIGTTTAHHGIVITEGGNTLRACQLNTVIGNIIDTVTGESIYLGAAGETNPTNSNTIVGNVIDNAHIAISSRNATSSGNTIKGNIIGSYDTSIWLDSPDISGDLTLVSTLIDLSGAATTEYLFFSNNKKYVIGSIRICFVEASSADAAVQLYIGTRADTDRYLKIEAGSDTMESIAAGSVIDFVNGPSATAEGVLNYGLLAANTPIKITNAGGKVGTGEILISLELFEVGI